MSRGPNDRQHEEPAVSKSDGTPAVEAGSWPFRRHEPADPMCYIGLARGRSAPPSNPLLPAALPGPQMGASPPFPRAVP